MRGRLREEQLGKHCGSLLTETRDPKVKNHHSIQRRDAGNKGYGKESIEHRNPEIQRHQERQ